MNPAVARIVSGGQSGVDRAALDVAVELGIPYAGWCPAGGWAEDLTEPPGLLARYPALVETETADPAERTELNVRDSDATLVVRAADAASPGTDLTIELAEKLGRPWLVTEGRADDVRLVEVALAWVRGLAADVGADLETGIALNVAGPRESEQPGVYDEARGFLRAVLHLP